MPPAVEGHRGGEVRHQLASRPLMLGLGIREGPWDTIREVAQVTLSPLVEGGAVVVTEARPADGDHGSHDEDEAFIELVPMLRRVISSRVKDPHVVDDLVQETLVRVMAARSRFEPEKLPHYASVTARNLVASMAEKNDRARERSHLLVDGTEAESPVADLLRQEERFSVTCRAGQASGRGPGPAHGSRGGRPRHHLDGRWAWIDPWSRRRSTRAEPARTCGSSTCWWPKRIEPPTDRCRPVLRALSSGDRRRQRELDVSGHLLACAACARVKDLVVRAPRRTSGGGCGPRPGVEGRRRRRGTAEGSRGRGLGRFLRHRSEPSSRRRYPRSPGTSSSSPSAERSSSP